MARKVNLLGPVGPDLRRIRARALGDNFDARLASDEAVGLGGVLWQLRIGLDLARALVE